MRKWIIGGSVLIALLLFYVAWPAWTGYAIKTALDDRDHQRLARNVDFPSVRLSLKPVVAGEVQSRIDQHIAELGPAGQLIARALRNELAPRLVDAAINGAVTPENVVKAVAEGRSLKDTIERVMGEEMGRTGTRLPQPKQGGGAGKPAEPATAPAAKPKLGLANVKRFVPTGLASFEVGVARDAKAAEPDVTATLAFQGGDWKVVAIRPRLDR